MGRVVRHMKVPHKSRKNYDPIRKLHMRNVQKINDLYIESQIAVEGLRLELDFVKTKAKTTKGSKFQVTVPSMKGKDVTISRHYDDIIKAINARIEYKEFVQSLIFAITLTESYIAEILLIILIAHPDRILISQKGNESQSYTIELRELLLAPSMDEIILDKATQRTRDVIFASPKVYIAYLEKIMRFSIREALITQFIEIKATRDVYVHDDGNANKT
jgi:hypothetical protein